MKYRKVALTATILVILSVLIAAYFVFASLSASFGNRKAFAGKGTVPAVSEIPITVIVDAGHGGIDPGAVDNGLIEKQLNLSVARKLRDFLSVSGVNVVMTRNDDGLLGGGETVRKHKAADLKERLDIINSTENCLCSFKV